MRALGDIDAGHALEEGGGVLARPGVCLWHVQCCTRHGQALGLQRRAEQPVLVNRPNRGKRVVQAAKLTVD